MERRRPLIAGNWKIYKSETEAEAAVGRLLELVHSHRQNYLPPARSDFPTPRSLTVSGEILNILEHPSVQRFTDRFSPEHSHRQNYLPPACSVFSAPCSFLKEDTTDQFRDPTLPEDVPKGSAWGHLKVGPFNIQNIILHIRKQFLGSGPKLLFPFFSNFKNKISLSETCTQWRRYNRKIKKNVDSFKLHRSDNLHQYSQKVVVYG